MDAQGKPLGWLANHVGGSLIGDPNQLVIGAAPLYEAQEGWISLLDRGALPDWVDAARLTALVVRQPLENIGCSQIVVPQPHVAFSAIVRTFLPAPAATEQAVAKSAVVDPTARIGDGCHVGHGVIIGRHVQIGQRCRIMPGVVIMDHSVIGDDCVLYANVTLYERTRIANRVTIHSGSVLGAHGFGYQTVDGVHRPTAQLGYVEIEDDVELGACVTIDRGTYGSTRIGRGTKIDNQVMIAHNCQIGQHNLLCSQVGIAGSCRTGDKVVLAGQVGLKDHISLGDGTIVGAQSGVMEDLEGDQIYLGSPATTQRDQMQIVAIQRRLPEMRKAIKELQREARATSSPRRSPSQSPSVASEPSASGQGPIPGDSKPSESSARDSDHRAA